MNGFCSIGARLSVIIGMLGAIAITPPSAHASTNASAGGSEPVPAFRLTIGSGPVATDITIPAGLLRHRIDGDGRRIDAENANYLLAPPVGVLALGLLRNKVCNWRIDFVYHDDRGVAYRRERGRVHHKCTGVLEQASARARRKTLPKFGRACAELRSNGKHLATQCHNITR